MNSGYAGVVAGGLRVEEGSAERTIHTITYKIVFFFCFALAGNVFKQCSTEYDVVTVTYHYSVFFFLQ